MSPTLRLPPPTWQALSLGVVVAAALLLSHPYTGIRHDGTLYAGEALARLLPGNFRDDIYFQYGSQGRFTLLPAFYAGLISLLGVGTGTIVGLLLAFSIYFAASVYVIAGLAPSRFRLVCLLSLVLGWSIYGGTRTFAYAEPFLTARSFAEPAVLFAIGLLLRDRLLATAMVLLAALVIHPLIATAGLLVAWLYLVQRDRRWLALGVVGTVVLAVLGAVRAGPFADVFSRYDAIWLPMVQEANPQAFVLQWSLLDYGVIVYNVVVLWFAAHVAVDPRVRRVIAAATIAGLGAIAISALTVDVALNPFFGKLQFWRAEWIMQWLAMATFPLVFVALWARGEHGRISACFLALGWMAPFSYAPAILSLFALLIDGLRSRFLVTPSTTRIVIGVVCLAALTIVTQHEVRAWKLGFTLELEPTQMLAQALNLNLVLLAIVFGFMAAGPRLGRAAPLVALLLLAGAFSLWDQRTSWTKTLESYRPGKPLWNGLIEPDAKVYWYRDLIAPWVLLGHGNYYTPQQNSGAVFSREMTIELDKRSRLTGFLDLQEHICRLMHGLNGKQSSCEPDTAAVTQLCTDGGIDYVVLQSRLDGAEPLADMATGVVEEGYEKRFFLYRCSAL